MAKMTFDKFDYLCDRIDRNLYKCENWWPTTLELKERVMPNPEKYLEFLVWIVETNDKPEEQKEKESLKLINKILRENLEIAE